MAIVHIVQFGFKPEVSEEKIAEVRICSSTILLCTDSNCPPDLPSFDVLEGQMHPSHFSEALHKIGRRRAERFSRGPRGKRCRCAPQVARPSDYVYPGRRHTRLCDGIRK